MKISLKYWPLQRNQHSCFDNCSVLKQMKFSRCTRLVILLISYMIQLTSEGHAWQGHDLLLYSTDKEINILNTSRNGTLKSRISNVARNLTQAGALTYNYVKQIICWSDDAMENIQCITYAGSDKNRTNYNPISIVSGVPSADGLACDWYTDKLYWIDSETKRIEVATMDGKLRKVLFWTELDLPRTIALIPMEGLMVWTDWGETPKIERAGMNGDPATRKKIVSKDIFWPNGLTIDYEEEKIYWIDAKLSFIDSMDYDGQNRQRVLEYKFEYPRSFTHFQNRFYYTDWKTWSIHRFDKGTHKVKAVEHFLDVPVDVHVWNPDCQKPKANPCENNGGCSHLCLLAPYAPGYSCNCPIGVKNIDNYTCANGPQELLLLARRTDICVVYLDSPEYTYKIIPLANTSFAIGIEYDLLEGYIYWTDDFLKKIQRARLDGSDLQDFVTNEIISPDGIAIDWLSRNLYWIDTGADRIEVITIEKRYRKVLIFEDLDEPRAISVAPELGWLFWSDWSDRKPKIERANLDGSERRIIVSKDLVWPNGVTLDLEDLKIYWCDAKKDKIEYANMDGTDRRVLISNEVPHVFGLSLMGEYLYWTDWQRRAIDRAHKESGDHREIIVEQLPNVMGLKSINLVPVKGWTPCVNNGNCSQICLTRHEKSRVCACQIDYELLKDGVTCIRAKVFILYTSNKTIGRVSVENEEYRTILPISGNKHASAIDFDVNSMRIYWSDIRLRTIMRAYVNGSDPHKVIESGLTSPNGIAIDWLGFNIYWTDSESNRIEVSRLMGSSRRTLVCENIDEPRSIIVDPLMGYMYWSEWGKSTQIKKAAMDGSNPRKFISTSHAYALTLDYSYKRLYWTEINNSIHSILSSDLDGNDKRFILRDDKFKPRGLTLFDSHIYWSEADSGEIYRADRDGSDRKRIYKLEESAHSLLVFDPNKQSGTNQCANHNGGCSHLCLTLPARKPGDPVTFTCACPTHFTFQDNQCIAPKQFMIYSQKNLAVRLILDTTECPEAVLPILGLKMVKAIEYDPVHNFLYWIEGKTHSLKRVEVTGSLMSTVVAGNKDVRPFDFALDPIGRILFWTCSVQEVINVTRLDNNISFGVMQRKDEKPRLLAIHATKRLLFYTDVGVTPQLVRTRLDGSHRIVITQASDIGAIAIDPISDLVLWAQGHSIHISNIDGENKHVLLNESNTRITQLTVHKGFLYWIDKELSQLQRVVIHSNQRLSTSIQASHITDLISVNKPDRDDACWNYQKKCSHFCILNGTSPVCACPKDRILQDDKRTCVILPNCGHDHFTCSVSQSNKRDCIPIAWRCDTQKDCKDGSDELGCATCGANQHKCNDGQCLDNVGICDDIPQCHDMSDEANCCKNSFRCPNTEICIPLLNVCDGTENCVDGADELLCVSSRSTNMILVVVLNISFVALCLSSIFYCRRKRNAKDKTHDPSADPLSPDQTNSQIEMQKTRRGIPDIVQMSMLNGSNTPSYDRSHITGASSSSNGSSNCYPRETLNPPPSPATTAASRDSSPSSRYRPYRHYRTINQPPPPTPCSTDVCDESDYNYPTRSRYDGGPFPPPPTPRSLCPSESCPPSPSSRSSTYFSPLPPPPSPVVSPRSYDS